MSSLRAVRFVFLAAICSAIACGSCNKSGPDGGSSGGGAVGGGTGGGGGGAAGGSATGGGAMGGGGGGGGGGGSGGDAGTDAGPTVTGQVACIWPKSAMVGQGPLPVSIYGTGFAAGAQVAIDGTARPTTVVDAGLLIVELAPEDLQAVASRQLTVIDAPDASARLDVIQPAARRRVPVDALYTQIERRGWSAEYWSGQLLQGWTQLDPVVGQTQAAEAQLQLDAMRAMGVNAITFELRTADGGGGPYTPPDCPMPWVLGLQYPQPEAGELSHLRDLLDLLQAEGMKVWLRLPNTYMEESPPANNAIWLGAILAEIKGHPAVDAVLFEGSPHVVNGQCGIPAEPPLWEGASSTTGQYVTWALGFALDAGFPARQLSAEEIVGAWDLIAPGTNLQDPVAVMKQIFDAVGVPESERTYALSMYEHPKCQNANFMGCVDERPDQWADETLSRVWDVVGRCGGARVIVPEMGTLPPLDGGWRAEWSVENLGTLFERYGVEGGSYWLWTQFQTSDDTNPTIGPAVKFRGTAFNYSKVQPEIADLGATHLAAIPNGSFERGDGGVDQWSTSGSVTRQAIVPQVVTRGSWVLRLDTGSSANATASASSAVLPVVGNTVYALTAQLRFAFGGDPDAGAPPQLRPQVRVSFHYFAADGGVASRAQDDVRFFQENSRSDFTTTPIGFQPPPDATQLQVELAVERNGLPSPVAADFDDLR